jgi:hypothetical protein
MEKNNHNILWSSPFKTSNPKVKFSYIKVEFQSFLRKSILHFPVLHNAEGCEAVRSLLDE